MKRFRFRLQALLDLKKRAEDRVKRDLAGKNAEIYAAREKLNDTCSRLRSFQESEKQSRAQARDSLKLRYSVLYRFKLKDDILREGRHVDTLSSQAESIRGRLVSAKKETKSLELIKDKRFARWKREYRINEQGIADDVSQQRFIREKRAPLE